MSSKKYLFTSESVTEGHPDKVCDQISDAILDEFLTKDSKSRVAAETSVTTGMVLVCGEITSSCYVDIPHVVRTTIENIGYTGKSSGGFDSKNCAVLTSIDEQSTDIAGGVNKAFETRDNNAAVSVDETNNIGAGDQGIMFGFACDETPELMPLPISLAHKLSYRLAEARKQGVVNYLRPDGKSQVTVEYENDKPVRIDTVVISTQHDEIVKGETDNTKVQEIIKKDIIIMWLKVVVGCIPAGLLVVFGLDEVCDALFQNYMTVAIMLIVVGVLFILIENNNKNKEAKITDISQITFKTAFIIGIFQLIAAVFPGTSRSGSTIVGSLLLGVSRTTAAEFTFFLAVPTMLGASLLKLLKFGFAFTGMEMAILLVGMAVAFVVSVVVIRFLMDFVKKHDFKVFGWYRIVLGIVVIAYFMLFA